MIDKRKINGIHFTPKNLGDFLSERILENIDLSSKGSLTIIDPACGEGELLESMSILLDSIINFQLIGYDISQDHISNTNLRLNSKKDLKYKLIHADYLDLDDNNKIELFDQKPSFEKIQADIIIANPPYVRTQVLGSDKAQYYAKKYNINGRIDLYFPFFISMTNNLKEGGLLGVLTSNKYLFTRSGESIRKYLIDNYEIIELIDLGDTKFFDAAILPAIFIGRKSKNIKVENGYKTNFTKIYEFNTKEDHFQTANSVIEVLNKKIDGIFKVKEKVYKQTVGNLIFTNDRSLIWSLCNNNETNWIDKINSSAAFKVSDFVKVRVGVKTTADYVFIRDDWEQLAEIKQPEKELLKPLISQENISKWNHIDKSVLKILYPYLTFNDKKILIDLNNYPKAEKYFFDFEKQLKSRKYLIDAGREWYEIWVPHHPLFWQKPKLVFPDISIQPRFHFDLSGSIVNGNCYWIISDKNNTDLLLLIQGIANSKLMTKYHDLCFNNKLYSGRRRYFSQYVEKYPIPDLNSIYSKNIINITKSLNNNSEKDIVLKLENDLEIAVAESFKVEPVFNLD